MAKEHKKSVSRTWQGGGWGSGVGAPPHFQKSGGGFSKWGGGFPKKPQKFFSRASRARPGPFGHSTTLKVPFLSVSHVNVSLYRLYDHLHNIFSEIYLHTPQITSTPAPQAKIFRGYMISNGAAGENFDVIWGVHPQKCVLNDVYTEIYE